MKNFFSNLFGKNKDPKSIISFDVINSIYAYLYHESNKFELNVKGIHDSVLVTLYSFPTSFDHEQGMSEIKKAGFENAYEVLNELFKKLDIGVLSQEAINQELEYDFIHIQFYSKPGPEMKKYFNHVLNNFIIFFCCTNSSETNDFKILYTTSYFTDYTRDLLDAESVNLNNPKTETQQIGVKDFKIVLQGICQYLSIEIHEGIELPSLENLIEDQEVTLEFFEEFIILVSRGNMGKNSCKNRQKNFLIISKKIQKNITV